MGDRPGSKQGRAGGRDTPAIWVETEGSTCPKILNTHVFVWLVRVLGAPGAAGGCVAGVRQARFFVV